MNSLDADPSITYRIGLLPSSLGFMLLDGSLASEVYGLTTWSLLMGTLTAFEVSDRRTWD